MKCFRHPDHDALGICKSCSKGVCSQCVTDVGGGLACKNSCENEVLALKQCEANAHRAVFSRPIVVAIGALMMIAMGIIGMGMGIGLSLTLIPFGGGVMFAALACWEANSVLKSRKSKTVAYEPPRQEIDHLDHEFKKLERDAKKPNDTD